MITRLATLSSRMAVFLALVFTVAACGGGGGSGGGFLGPEDEDTPLRITTTELPAASAGADYTVLLKASGGKGSYSWVILDDDGTGFTINSEGFLTGKAPEKGDYGLTIQVTDSNNNSDKFSTVLTVDVSPDSLAIVTTGLPNGIEGIPYTALVQATGGEEPYTWSLANDGGTGFSIDNEGFITGTAPESGEYGMTLQVTDDTGTIDKTSLVYRVTGDTPQQLSIATTSLPNTEEGKGYNALLEAVGGDGDYMWTMLISGGSGLQLRDDGLLSGTAPEEGQYAITVSVQDDVRTITETLLLTVAAQSSPLTITTASLPDGTVKERYAAVLNASGGKEPHAWTLVSSGGQAGLALSPEGILSGTPTVPGTFGLIFRVSDSTGTDQLAMTLTISPVAGGAPSLQIVTASLPPADRVLYAAALQASGGVKPYTWFGEDIIVDSGDPDAPVTTGTGFEVDPTSGAISGNSNELLPGQYSYSVTVTDSLGATVVRSYVITVPGGDTPPVRILTDTLPVATESLTYAVVMRGVGGGPDKIWQVLETLKEDGTVYLAGPTFAPPGSADSGVLYWAAGDIEAGNYRVTIQVTSSDADTSADVVTFDLRAE